MADVELLSEPTNYAVVHLAGRAFPGVVFQGDSLHNLISGLRQAALEPDEKERSLALSDILDHLVMVQRFYERTLDCKGISTPYQRD